MRKARGFSLRFGLTARPSALAVPGPGCLRPEPAPSPSPWLPACPSMPEASQRPGGRRSRLTAMPASQQATAQKDRVVIQHAVKPRPSGGEDVKRHRLRRKACARPEDSA